MINEYTNKKSKRGTALAIACTLVLLAGCAGNKPEKSEKDAPAAARLEQVVPVVTLQKHQLDTELDLPGQLLAFQDVPLHAKVEGYISMISVDRGSHVKKGQLLIVITAPEVDAKVREAESKLAAAEASYKEAVSAYESALNKKSEAVAKYEADKLTYTRLAQAAKTPGAIAQNEVDLAEKLMEEDKAHVDAINADITAAANVVAAQKNNVTATKNVVDATRAMRSYLEIRAPFDGVITERNVHQGSIVSVSQARQSKLLPMLRIQEEDHLRLVVAVPEACVSGIELGKREPFTVPAYPGRIFYGTIARPGYSLDLQTRTMPVELDVPNPERVLEPGMFATVKWRVTRPYPTLFAPASAVGDDLKGTFVIRVVNGTVERVPVTRGQPMGNLVEVIGKVKEGDQVTLAATDEFKTGTRIATRPASEAEIEGAMHHASAGGE